MRPVSFGYLISPRGEGDPAREPQPSHRLLLRDGREAERLGFDAVWVADHFYVERPTRLETCPEVWTLLTAIGLATERVRVGTMVLAAGFRHPAVVAKMAGALQELVGGRLVLGLGAGNQPNEHAAYGFGFEGRVGRFAEYLPIVAALLAGETVTVEGRHYTLREASLRTPVPPVPIWVAAGGERMFGLTARYAQGWNLAGGTSFDEAAFRTRYDGFAAACRAAGRGPREYEVSLLSLLGVAEDAASARETLEAMAADAGVAPDVLARTRAIGTPDQIAAKIQTMAGLGVDHFVCIVNMQPRPERLWDRVELLAREVLPRVRAAR